MSTNYFLVKDRYLKSLTAMQWALASYLHQRQYDPLIISICYLLGPWMSQESHVSPSVVNSPCTQRTAGYMGESYYSSVKSQVTPCMPTPLESSMTSKVVFWQMPETSDASPENCNGCCGDRMTSEKSDEICQSAQGVVDHAATWQCTWEVLWELWQTWVLGCFA